ncbi:hypothetical protein PR202_gb19816 [Eleusine coracana subsp. coracana]|uniref:Uncharacterized protein n=1 Tax=Eleusine coracana subsp. coracana TaxID=191504 RepID=A0AAV5FAP0_ELECO|nr:hypothetical protein PR202_gb19816 [Eleusine coracana subsp. coracana]
MITFATTTIVGSFGLKVQSPIDGKQFKFLAPSGHHAWNKCNVSIQVVQMLKIRS